MNRNSFISGLALSAVFCLALAVTATAQPQDRPQRPTPEARVAEMDKAVTLTADQKTKILKIYQDIEANGSQGGRGFFGANAEVEKALTPEQLKKWRAYTLQQSVDRMMNRINEAVTLTDDQKKKVAPILEKQITGQNEFMAKQREAGGDFDRDAFMAKMTELREATAKALEPILTKEQMDKYKAMPQGFGGRRQ